MLEDRLAPAVITVTTTADTIAIDGLATLREAITSINNQADVNGDVTLNRVGGYASTPGGTSDVIDFIIPGAGVKTIFATAAEPTIIKPLTINGYSQPGASANTLANSDNAVILIQLDGTFVGPGGVSGLVLVASSGGSTINGLDVTNFSGNGIFVLGNANNILGDFIGVDPTGTTRKPNGLDGIRIFSGSSNQIGSTNPADRNLVSTNSMDGIHIEGFTTAPATGNIVEGNFAGVAVDGKSNLGNTGFGIEVSGGSYNQIGGPVAGARNVVGFNAAGIEVDNGGQNNVIQGNFSGVGADGVTTAGNTLHGIVLHSNGASGGQPNEPGVSFNLIGGTAAGDGNLVENNGAAGIAVYGNPIALSGQPNVGNAIEGNTVFLNGRSHPSTLIGIDLSNSFPFPTDDGVTPNDSKGHGAPGDPNNFQNFPVLTTGVSGNGHTVITGTLHAAPNLTYRIEFFASNPDPLGGAAEGQQFIGFLNTTTDANGNVAFTVTFNGTVANGRALTATATDPLDNTSEFSAGLVLAANDTVGIFNPNAAVFHLSNALANPGSADIAFQYGGAGWKPIAGNFSGTGLSTPGVFDPNNAIFHVSKVLGNPGSNDIAFQYGGAGWDPIAGNFFGTSTDTVGVFDPTNAIFHLSNVIGNPGSKDYAFQYGGTGWIPLVGNFFGTPNETIGVFDPNNAVFHISNVLNNPGAADFAFQYGGKGWIPFVGDFFGTGHDTVGVFDPTNAIFHLSNVLGNPGANDIAFQYGSTGWVPIAGDWDFPTLPQLAAGGEARIASGTAPLTAGQLQSEVQVALNLLASDGVNSALLARLGSLQFTVGTLPAGYLGSSNLATGTVEISADAAGYGWFVDATPSDRPPADRMDLLTVVLHEMGHFNGWTELDPAINPDELMALTLGTGQSRTQNIDAVFAAGL